MKHAYMCSFSLQSSHSKSIKQVEYKNYSIYIKTRASHLIQAQLFTRNHIAIKCYMTGSIYFVELARKYK